MTTVLVTGGCGFIGSHACVCLLEQNYNIVVLDSNINSSPNSLIGVKNISTSDSIKIYGKSDLNLNGNFSMKNYLKDHRVFMMTVVAALTLGGNWKIYDADCFKTSFPSFLKLIRKVGGKYH